MIDAGMTRAAEGAGFVIQLLSTRQFESDYRLHKFNCMVASILLASCSLFMFHLIYCRGGNMSKLTDALFNLTELTNGRYSVCGEYTGYNKPLKIRCNVHEFEFEMKEAERVYHIINQKYIDTCPKCHRARLDEDKVEVVCAYCGKKFLRSKNWSAANKTDLAFCCREHKDLAQRRDGGVLDMFLAQYEHHFGRQPIHDKSIPVSMSYRAAAFAYYPHKCAVCGYDEHDEILEVHHIDEDRSHNELSNLVILCPICHRKISLKLYRLEVIDNTYKLHPISKEERNEYFRSVRDTHRRPGICVRCIEDNISFKSLSAAGSYYGVTGSTILAGLDKHGGFCKKLNKHFEQI